MAPTQSTPLTGPSPTHLERPVPRLLRCACAFCGTHTNAVRTFRVIGSCSNCGSFDLLPIEGAEPLSGQTAA